MSWLWENGGACMCTAAIIKPFSSLFIKLMDNVPEFEVVFARSFFSFFASIFTSYTKGTRPMFGHRQNLLYLLGRATCGSVAVALFYFTLSQLNLADATALYFTNPAVTAIFARIVLKEPLGGLSIVGILMGLAGVTCVSQPPAIFDPDEKWNEKQALGTLLGLSSAVLISASFIFVRLIGKRETPVTMSVWFHLMSLITSGIPLAFSFPERPVIPSIMDCGLMLGVAASSFFGQLLIGRGLQLLNAAHASAINVTQVMYSYIFGVFFLGENVTWLSLSGSLLIGGGVILVSTNQSRIKKQLAQQQQQQQQQQEEYKPLRADDDSSSEDSPDAPSPQQNGSVPEVAEKDMPAEATLEDPPPTDTAHTPSNSPQPSSAAQHAQGASQQHQPNVQQKGQQKGQKVPKLAPPPQAAQAPAPSPHTCIDVDATSPKGGQQKQKSRGHSRVGSANSLSQERKNSWGDLAMMSSGSGSGSGSVKGGQTTGDGALRE